MGILVIVCSYVCVSILVWVLYEQATKGIKWGFKKIEKPQIGYHGL